MSFIGDTANIFAVCSLRHMAKKKEKTARRWRRQWNIAHLQCAYQVAHDKCLNNTVTEAMRGEMERRSPLPCAGQEAHSKVWQDANYAHFVVHYPLAHGKVAHSQHCQKWLTLSCASFWHTANYEFPVVRVWHKKSLK